MTPFRYTSLNTSQSIRLLILNPSFSRGAPLKCYMKTFDLSSLPKYEALSYTWEGQSPSQPIQCNGSKLLVTPNVEAALKQLRRRLSRRCLWVDAICIDQANLKEQSRQVSLMHQIYRNAVQVVVWLGGADRMTARAFRLLKWVFPLYKLALHLPFTRYISLGKFRKLKEKFQDVLLNDYQGLRQHNGGTPEQGLEDSLRGLHRIFHHDWFRRIWTLQEISLASKATVVCGDSRIGWTALSNAMTFDGIVMRPAVPTPVLMEGGYNPAIPIYNNAPFISRMQQIQILREWFRRVRLNQSWPIKYLLIQDQPPLSFTLNLLLIGLNPDYRVTDPRDRVFGLLGLLRGFGIHLPAPNYDKRLPDLIFDAFTAISTRYKSLELLHFVSGENTFDDLPSWIPDFNAVPWYPGTVNSELPSRQHREKQVTDFTINGRKLSLSGSFVDRISFLTEPIRCEDSLQGEHPYGVIDIPSETFLARIREWIHFVHHNLASHTYPQLPQNTTLFKLLLHPQTTPIYHDANLPLHSSQFDCNRLLQHFICWLDCVKSHDTILTSTSDHMFDQVQHFISSERINTSSGVIIEHTLGYQRALLVIQRWVREHTARKRLFTTASGCVGIGWQAVEEEDLVVRVRGVRSPLVVRRVEKGNAEFDDTYRLIGPCYIPVEPEMQPWKEDLEHKIFQLV